MKKILLLLLFGIFILLLGCSQEASETEIITEKINEELGISPFIPNSDFPITTVIIEYDYKMVDGEVVKGNPRQVVIDYLYSKGEKIDEDTKSAWEESERKKVIYGDLYIGQSAILITISKGGIGNLSGAKTIDIDGHEVQYQLVVGDTSSVIMLMDFNDFGYKIHYNLLEGASEEDAKLFAKEIINAIR